MKKIFFAFLSTFIFLSSFAQTTPEERFQVFKDNYKVVMEKFNAGTITLEDENYYACRKILRKISSYDKATTMKSEEFINMKKTFDGLKSAIQMGSVYLSSTADGSASATSFKVGSPMYLVIKGGNTFVKESLRTHPKVAGKKVLTLSYSQVGANVAGLVYLEVPSDKLDGHELITDITLDGAKPEFNDVYLYLGGLPQGKNKIEFAVMRGEFATSISKPLPSVYMDVVLDIQGDKMSKMADKANEAAYSSVVLGKAAVSNPELEGQLKTLYSNAYPDHKVLRLIIEEDWYDLKENNHLTYKKLNCYLAVTKPDGECYRVHVGYVKENMSDIGVELGPIKILNTGAKLRYTKMPLENVNK